MDPIEALRIRGIGGGKKPTGNAVAGDVRVGKTFSTTAGYDLSGTMPVQSTVAQTVTPTTLNITKQAGIYDGDITIQGDVNLVGANILSGKSVFGVTGTLQVGKKFASGTAAQTNGSTVLSFVTRTSPTVTANASFAYITVSGLSFKPSVIVATDKTGPYQSTTVYNANSNYYGVAACDISSGVFTGTTSDIRFIDITGNANVTNTGFTLPINNSSSSQTIDWVAYE